MGEGWELGFATGCRAGIWLGLGLRLGLGVRVRDGLLRGYQFSQNLLCRHALSTTYVRGSAWLIACSGC